MKKTFAALTALGLSGAVSADPVVVTSIKPVSMIVAAIAGDHAKVEQIVSNNASPHDFALRPSDLRKLSNADSIVWVSHSLEHFLTKPIANLNESKDIEWADLSGVHLQNFGDKHEHHHDEDHDEHEDHDDHHDEHADHDEHEGHDEHHDEHADHDNHDEHEGHDEHHDEHAGHDEHEGHDEHHDEHADHDEHEGHEGHHHDHSGVNPHVWMDPHNAMVLAEAVKDQLSKIDPDSAAYYEENFHEFEESVEEAEHKIEHELEDVSDVPYVVFHDAYGYFESHFGLHNAGAVTLSPERKPGAKTVADIRERIQEHQIQCIFSEPQFSPAIVETLVEGTDVKTAVLDPLGGKIEIGKNAYVAYLKSLEASFISCLK
ncbi:zinc ABC transporter substrate-binding protein [Marinomonas mediterranea]|jgi:ABC-type Zn2+ transport system, periplasmic component/surface adhesin|uniref:High-affinity zinc uptake system protein ZnuA n=1 Tax=Marinomonas mediterranea (strain ATCC 700492 / JCM 21426 / NBRC 103028 / MMB-1) TaxID=717774 RepID=F2K4V0_MARM1|nr:zinc ABC transporter substrate-binding protein [Marinomonas mediterranea]ADZ92593.1 ABC-type metal ion transporter, periplasmic subunit [Marinomonas mediterranea MMB-1]WCN10536.1 zinc ABC transporter solute-binding protein [Marinomonas mediterranea]WCN18635.1 zinc ABC transporter solute-binding protein [Marinomonas mediterranea MMB-1]